MKERCYMHDRCMRDKGHLSPTSPCFSGGFGGVEWQQGFFIMQDGKEWVHSYSQWPKDARRRAHLEIVKK